MLYISNSSMYAETSVSTNCCVLVGVILQLYFFDNRQEFNNLVNGFQLVKRFCDSISSFLTSTTKSGRRSGGRVHVNLYYMYFMLYSKYLGHSKSIQQKFVSDPPPPPRIVVMYIVYHKLSVLQENLHLSLYGCCWRKFVIFLTFHVV